MTEVGHTDRRPSITIVVQSDASQKFIKSISTLILCFWDVLTVNLVLVRSAYRLPGAEKPLYQYSADYRVTYLFFNNFVIFIRYSGLPLLAGSYFTPALSSLTCSKATPAKLRRQSEHKTKSIFYS